MFPFEDEQRRERRRLIETVDGLSDDEFTSGRTLCEVWSPRDVLGHVIGVDAVGTYVAMAAGSTWRTPRWRARLVS